MAASSNQIVIVGASVRAAAWSALRAGLEPYGIDLFADRDLCRVATLRRIPSEDYPEGLVTAIADAPDAPVFFTGALENRPRLVQRLCRQRRLWGNGPDVLRQIRSPVLVAQSLQCAGLPCPAVRRDPPVGDRRPWLVKPVGSAGGRSISFWNERYPIPARSCYFQEWIDGEPCSAAFLARNDGTVRLLGLTRQLIGISWLNAGPFQYCGSAGPLPLTKPLAEHLGRLGDVLTKDFALQGLFGVDCVIREDVPWPVEVNPRYTASMEIIEYAQQEPFLAEHAQVFGAETLPCLARPTDSRGGMLAKGVIFANHRQSFPTDGPWCETLASPWQPWSMPDFTDIPAVGQEFLPGQPIMTIFARGENVARCIELLQLKAAKIVG